MRRWLLWLLPGVVIVTTLMATALALNLHAIEMDLANRVDAELVADGQSWATAEISGRTATVMGTAPTLVAQRLAVESADRVWGVSRVVDGSGILPLQPVYRWSATRSAGKLRIDGFIPSEDDRLAVLAAVARVMPDVEVEETMQLARGQPVDFLGLVDFALSRLAELANGSVSLTGPALTIDGTAASEADFASAAAALSALPPTASVQSIRVLPPMTARFEWRLDFDGKHAKMSGFVPSASSRRDVEAALRATIPDITFEDSTALASGAPTSFASASVFAAYQLAHLTEGSATLDGPTLSMEGKAKSVSDYEQALAEVDARRGRQAGGIVFGSIDIVPAAVDPYVWRADRNDGTVTITGYVPTVEARETVLAKAKALFASNRLIEHLRVADGDPKMDWIGAISFALDQLSRLGKGSVALSGRNYDISGEAISTPAYRSLTEELGKTLPASMELRHGAVAPAPISPFLFTAARAADRVTLSGYVPTEEVAKDIIAVAKPKFGGDAVDIKLELAGGAPDDFDAAVAAGLQAVSRLEGGRFDLTDRKLSVSGVAVSESARNSIASAMQDALPDGFSLTTSIIVAVAGDPLSGEDCQAALRQETANDQIVFDNRATISEDSYGLIDRLAAIAQRCPAATIEVAGHTDSTGGTRKNQAISEERARAVVDRLVEDGVRRERLSAVGYGQSRPIASNSTAGGRAQNRRIEFAVVGQ